MCPLAAASPRHAGVYTSDITYEDLHSQFHLPALDAAKNLGLGLTIFKARAVWRAVPPRLRRPRVRVLPTCLSRPPAFPLSHPQRVCRKHGVKRWPFRSNPDKYIPLSALHSLQVCTRVRACTCRTRAPQACPPIFTPPATVRPPPPSHAALWRGQLHPG